jgi:dTDP-glucose 4,6-dehydratase
VTNLLDGEKVPLYGEGANVRDWLFVDDHCRGIQLVVEKGEPGEYYNIGGGRELSNKELTEKLLEATGRDWSYVENIIDPRGGGHDLRYSVDYSKTAELGYAPRMSFEDGLALTVQWYRDNRAWWEPLKASAATAHQPDPGDAEA